MEPTADQNQAPEPARFVAAPSALGAAHTPDPAEKQQRP